MGSMKRGEALLVAKQLVQTVLITSSVSLKRRQNHKDPTRP